MSSIADIGIWAFVFVAAVYALGGYVKGAIGFALPLIAVSGGATVLDAQTAVAMVILPTLLSNIVQAFRQGVAPLVETAERFWPVNLVIVVMIVLCAPLLPLISDWAFYLTLGIGAGIFAALQLAGWRPFIPPRHERGVGLGVGFVAGFYGGLSGIWGPPFVLYVTALKLPKAEQVRATGLCFLLGSVTFLLTHALLTGVVNAETAALSAAMIPFTLAGQYFGQRAQDRLDVEVFRRITLIVLVISSLNLIRRALF